MASAMNQTGSSGPHLHGNHGLLGADGREKVLFAHEVQRELDQEATDLLELLPSLSRVLFGQSRLGQETLQLRHAADIAGRQTAENLEESERRNGVGHIKTHKAK